MDIKFFFAKLTAIIGLSSLLFACSTVDFTVVVPKKSLQEKLAEQFPIEKKKLLMTYRIFDPVVELVEDSNRVCFGLSLELSIMSKVISGSAVLSSSLYYSTKDKAFYMLNPRVESLLLPGVRPVAKTRITDSLERVTRVLLTNYPIYRLNRHNLRHALAGVVLKKVTVRSSYIELTLGS